MKAIEIIYLVLLVFFSVFIDTKGEPCSTAKGLPVVNICKDDTKIQDMRNSVLIKANTTKNCTCELYVTDQDQAIAVNIQKYDTQTSSSPSKFGCGLILEFRIRGNNFWSADCIIDNRITPNSIQTNDVMTIRSFAVNGKLKPDEGYCIEIKKASHVGEGNKLNLKCGINRTTIFDTTPSVETTTRTGKTTQQLQLQTTMTAIAATHEKVPTTLVQTTTTAATTKLTTMAIITTIVTDELTNGMITSADSAESTKQMNQQSLTTDGDDTEIVAAGAAGGGFVVLIAVIIVVVFYRRYHQKPIPQPGPAFDNDLDEYGMRDNVLYVSSQLTDIAESHDKSESQDTNRISMDIDGNYNTVDLDEIPAVDESTGDYSSIDLDKLTPIANKLMSGSANNKPIIAQKPKQKTTIQDDVYAVPDKKRVKHVTAPGEDMCEYAVVSKTNKSNVDKSEDQSSTNNVYAVVAKTKRISDGKGTNPKRDSLTSENDRETGRSSKS